MDLVTLLEHVPPLREACVSKDNATLKAMRLVSKEVGRVALMGLTSFILYLKGRDNDSPISVARLLQHARLKELTVLLTLSRKCASGSCTVLSLFRGITDAAMPVSLVCTLNISFSQKKMLGINHPSQGLSKPTTQTGKQRNDSASYSIVLM